MNITLIAGARPNFMKIAPLIHAIQKAEAAGKDIHYRLVHTGQHYDKNMSDTFFEELGIPAPDINLGCGGGTQAEQTAHIMVEFEKDLIAHPTDVVLVVGDVTSTMACSIVAKKLNTRVAHVEAGIRSWDLTMPEEINRMVTDSLADYMFTTSNVADRNLLRQGAIMVDDAQCTMHGDELAEDKYAYERCPQRVWRVGNVMIDTLLKNMPRFTKPAVYDELGLQDGKYIMMTMHRPANVDEETHLRALMEQIITNVHDEPIVFPIHPRTAKIFYGLWGKAGDDVEANRKALSGVFPNLHIVDPMGYLEFNYMVQHSRAVVTDSGGITEETTVMGIPCITLRDNTERPETCTVGTNELIGTNPTAVKPALDMLYAGQWKKGAIPELWDGHTAERIVDIFINEIANHKE